jgi:hypothetical protein
VNAGISATETWNEELLNTKKQLGDIEKQFKELGTTGKVDTTPTTTGGGGGGGGGGVRNKANLILWGKKN